MEVLARLLERLRDLALDHYGANLCALVVFGSAARGDYDRYSDLDLLVILKEVRDSFGRRLDGFFLLTKRLKASREYKEAKVNGLPYKVQPVVLSIEELKTHPPLLLDLTTDALILLDREAVFGEEIEKIKSRMKELGSRKVFLEGNRWYWILKPDIKRGEVVHL